MFCSAKVFLHMNVDLVGCSCRDYESPLTHESNVLSCKLASKLGFDCCSVKAA